MEENIETGEFDQDRRQQIVIAATTSTFVVTASVISCLTVARKLCSKVVPGLSKRKKIFRLGKHKIDPDKLNLFDFYGTATKVSKESMSKDSSKTINLLSFMHLEFDEVKKFKDKGFRIVDPDYMARNNDSLTKAFASKGQEFAEVVKKFKMDPQESRVLVYDLSDKGLYTFAIQDNSGKQVFGVFDSVQKRMVFTEDIEVLRKFKWIEKK